MRQSVAPPSRLQSPRAKVTSSVMGRIMGSQLTTSGAANSSAGVDGRANPVTPDTSGAMMDP
jgi:hypothetical protein